MSEILIKNFNAALEIKDIIKDDRIQLNKLSDSINAAPDSLEAAQYKINNDWRYRKNKIHWLSGVANSVKGDAEINYNHVISVLKAIFADPKKIAILQQFSKYINLGEIMGIIFKESSGSDKTGTHGELGLFQYKSENVDEMVKRLKLEGADTAFCGLIYWLDFKKRRTEILFKRIPGCNDWSEEEKKAFMHRVYNRGSIMIALLGKMYQESEHKLITFTDYEEAWQKLKYNGIISLSQIDPSIVKDFILTDDKYSVGGYEGWDIGNRYSSKIGEKTKQFQ